MRIRSLTVDRAGPAAVVGVAAGLVGGLFGVGGGVIVVPGLILWVGMEVHRASATSVATIVASSAAALVSFAADGSVNWVAAVVVFAGSGIGAAVGARVMARIPDVWLARAFTVVLFAAAVRMGIG